MFYRWGIYENHHLYFHVLGGVYLALGLLKIFNLEPYYMILIVGGIAFFYELIAYWSGGWKKLSVPSLKISPRYPEEYWQKKRYKVDALCDIFGAIAGALGVLLAYSYGISLCG